MNPALHAHLAECLRIARSDWAPAAIGVALGRIASLPDAQALLQAAACAAEPDAKPGDIGDFGAVRPARTHDRPVPRAHNSGVYARGSALARAELEAALRGRQADKQDPDVEDGGE